MPAKNNKEAMNEVTGEVVEVSAGTELAPRSEIGGIMLNGMQFQVKQLVNVPTLKHDTGQTVAITPLMPIVHGMNEQEKEVTVNGVKVMATEQVPINVVRVRNLADGLEYELVLNAISADSFKNAYPADSYVGKHFAIRKGEVVTGKRYKSVEIVELEMA